MGSSWVVFLRQILNMADKDKKKKKKAAAEPDTTPEAPPSTPASSVKKPSGKKAKRGNSNVFETFSQLQVAEFKEGFQFMDRDKDGMIGKGDIRATADEVGKLLSDAEIDEMLADAPGPINFTMLINMFAQREQGGASDEDAVIVKAFKTFSTDGLIDADGIREALMAFGEKFTTQEVDDFFDQVEINEGKINTSGGFVSRAGTMYFLYNSYLLPSSVSASFIFWISAQNKITSRTSN